MKRRLLVVCGLLFLSLTVLGLVGMSMGTGLRTRHPSSLAGEAEGVLAFRRLLLELGWPVETLQTGWDGADLTESGVLIVTTPTQRGIRAEEIPALSAWVQQGGTLLVVEDATGLERSPALERFLAETGLESTVPVTDINPTTLKPVRPPRFPSSAGPGLPQNLKVRRVQLNDGAKITGSASTRALLLSDDGHITAAMTPHGEGRVALVLGPLLANDRLLEGDTLNFALWLVDKLRRGGPVRFDEYHHGHGGIIANLGKLNRAALGWAALQAFLAGVLYSVTRGVRFGPVRPVPEPPRRSNLEFVYSMASMYRRAAAGRHALTMMLSRIRRETRWLGGNASSRSTAELAAGLSERYRLHRGNTTMALRAAEQAAEKSRLSDRELLWRAGDLAGLQQEITGEHRESD